VSNKSRILELQFSKSMIEQVMADYEREHPGVEMTGKEFADRMMAKIKETARFTDDPKH
jgi:hypothetical protein